MNIPLTGSVLLIGSKSIIDEKLEKLLAERKIDKVDLYCLENPKIEELRYSLDRVQLKPYQSKFSCLILPNIEQWRVELINCILKTLEEPPKHLLIILTAQDESSILDTVLSRTTKVYIGREQTDVVSLLNLDSDLPSQFDQIKKVTEENSASEVLTSILGDSTPSQQYFILNLLRQIGNAPVNKKLVLESSCLELLALEGERDTIL
ncbi:hypothetical protein KC644_03915 [Candidatus Berkelbacteria bacterium]|nr:hypothetical protein [Candidatus Berkelbacteria bacterium]